MIYNDHINNKLLSTRKYVYRIYIASDNMYHCEKYPVIYANSYWTYYKVTNKAELFKAKTDYITTLDSSLNCLCKIADTTNRSMLFWKPQDVQYEKEKLNKKALQLLADMKRDKAEYDSIQRRLTKLDN